MTKITLDKVIKEKVEPLVNEAMHKYLGVTIREIPSDISDKIEKSPLLSYDIDINIKFKIAKKIFKREFFIRLLQSHYGNISLVAKITGVDRRSIHRDIKEFKIDVDKMRKDMVKTEYYQREAVYNIVRSTIDSYKTVLNPSKLEKIYANVEELGTKIAHSLPTIEMTWDEAEKEFEREYLKRALVSNSWNISLTAKKIGIRYETLHRKIKSLGIYKN